MNTSTILSLLLFVITSAGCATPLETVGVPTDPSGWRVGYSSPERGKTIIVYVPREESISNWTKQFTIQFHEDVKASPIAWMTDLRSLMQKRCPGSYWQVLNQDSASVLYEWKISGCGGNPNQHEIARLLKGNDGLHRIAYVEHASTIDPAVRDQWIKAFSDAYVHKNGKRIVTAP